ncbi:hypothetical protein [Microbacterium sp.]|uniref:hypothetical protein n=1 Tax=Microbacterium sp. TaxID=51671 RepID=UPI0039E26512
MSGDEMAEQVRIWAGVTGFLSAASLLALVLFFALARPWGDVQAGWFWLGPTNDWLSVLGAVPWIVATILLARHARLGGAWWVLTGAVVAGIAAMAIVTLVMLAGRTTLEVQTITALPAVLLAFVWTAIATSAAVRQGALPGWVAGLAVALVVALVVGALLIGVAFLVPEGPSRVVLWVVGGVPGGLAWLGYPAAWLCIAARVS